MSGNGKYKGWFRRVKKEPAVLCIACGKEGVHFVPNSLDRMGGWFTCWPIDLLRKYRRMWDIQGNVDYRFSEE